MNKVGTLSDNVSDAEVGEMLRLALRNLGDDSIEVRILRRTLDKRKTEKLDIPTLPEPAVIEREIGILRSEIAELKSLLTLSKRQHAARLISGRSVNPDGDARSLVRRTFGE